VGDQNTKVERSVGLKLNLYFDPVRRGLSF
jgi:hypothetical protein